MWHLKVGTSESSKRAGAGGCSEAAARRAQGSLVPPTADARTPIPARDLNAHGPLLPAGAATGARPPRAGPGRAGLEGWPRPWAVPGRPRRGGGRRGPPPAAAAGTRWRAGAGGDSRPLPGPAMSGGGSRRRAGPSWPSAFSRFFARSPPRQEAAAPGRPAGAHR